MKIYSDNGNLCHYLEMRNTSCFIAVSMDFFYTHNGLFADLGDSNLKGTEMSEVGSPDKCILTGTFRNCAKFSFFSAGNLCRL